MATDFFGLNPSRMSRNKKTDRNIEEREKSGEKKKKKTTVRKHTQKDRERDAYNQDDPQREKPTLVDNISASWPLPPPPITGTVYTTLVAVCVHLISLLGRLSHTRIMFVYGQSYRASSSGYKFLTHRYRPPQPADGLSIDLQRTNY